MTLQVQIPKTDWIHGRTEHLSIRENPLPIKLNGEELKNVDHFKYLGSVIDKDGASTEKWTFGCMLHGQAGEN